MKYKFLIIFAVFTTIMLFSAKPSVFAIEEPSSQYADSDSQAVAIIDNSGDSVYNGKKERMNPMSTGKLDGAVGNTPGSVPLVVKHATNEEIPEHERAAGWQFIWYTPFWEANGMAMANLEAMSQEEGWAAVPILGWLFNAGMNIKRTDYGFDFPEFNGQVGVLRAYPTVENYPNLAGARYWEVGNRIVMGDDNDSMEKAVSAAVKELKAKGANHFIGLANMDFVLRVTSRGLGTGVGAAKEFITNNVMVGGAAGSGFVNVGARYVRAPHVKVIGFRIVKNGAGGKEEFVGPMQFQKKATSKPVAQTGEDADKLRAENEGLKAAVRALKNRVEPLLTDMKPYEDYVPVFGEGEFTFVQVGTIFCDFNGLPFEGEYAKIPAILDRILKVANTDETATVVSLGDCSNPGAEQYNYGVIGRIRGKHGADILTKAGIKLEIRPVTSGNGWVKFNAAKHGEKYKQLGDELKAKYKYRYNGSDSSWNPADQAIHFFVVFKK
jgi:hypothetical protein